LGYYWMSVTTLSEARIRMSMQFIDSGKVSPMRPLSTRKRKHGQSRSFSKLSAARNWFRVWGSGFRDWGLVFSVQGLGFRD